MEPTLEKTYHNNGYEKPPDPCAVAVIYSDCQNALRRIGNSISGEAIIAQIIRNQAKELQELGDKAELHWCPGHSKVPGNELAYRLAKEATFHPQCKSRQPQLRCPENYPSSFESTERLMSCSRSTTLTCTGSAQGGLPLDDVRDPINELHARSSTLGPMDVSGVSPRNCNNHPRLRVKLPVRHNAVSRWRIFCQESRQLADFE